MQFPGSENGDCGLRMLDFHGQPGEWPPKSGNGSCFQNSRVQNSFAEVIFKF